MSIDDPQSISLRALELPAILERLAAHTTFPPAADLVRRPSLAREPAEARRRQAQTSQARRYLEGDPNPDLSAARDIRQPAGRAAKGAILGAEELLAVAATLRTSAAYAAALYQGAEEWPVLPELAEGLTVQTPLLRDLERSIDPDGQVLDEASPGLARVRAQRRTLQGRLQSKLEEILNSASAAPHLQERLITQRAGRYVLPIKAEARGRFQGIVHDESSSGLTLFVEPLATVELNNELRHLEREEEREIQAVLAAFSQRIGQIRAELQETVETLAELDHVFSRAKYARELGAHAPQLAEDGAMELRQARHPLLDPQTVVPIDVTVGGEHPVLLITGPNTGGKTVSLKTVGLCALMAQLGLHLPAAPGSRMPLYEGVYADIGDEQSIEQSLSTFSSHMGHIIHFLRVATPGSLLLLDELGAGTDPIEGSALARSLIRHLLERGSTLLATTHYSELKAFAHQTPGVRNASVEFDPETLAPTYQLTIGLPGRSNALAIAGRLGLDEAILERAARWVPTSELEMESLLQEIRTAREEARQREASADRIQAEAERLRRQAQEELEALRREGETLRGQARREVEAELGAVWEELRRLRRRLAEAPQPQTLEEVGAGLQAIQEEVSPPGQAEPLEELRPGMRVRHRSLNQEGEVLELRDGEVDVQLGAFRMTVRPEELAPARADPPGRGQRRQATPDVRAPQPREVPMELHLRGLRAEEALERLERYLDQAALAGLPRVRIVHGKGTGRLRELVREHLRHHPLVKEVHQPPEREGGAGVTEVAL